MFCRNCGASIAEGSSICRFCGCKQENVILTQNNDTEKLNYNTLCIVGLIISTLGIFGIVGLIISIIGLRDCKKKNQKGKIIAIVGIVRSFFSTFFEAILIVNILYSVFNVL